MAEALTERQQEIYDFIVWHIECGGYPPTVREIGAHVGIRSTNGVQEHLLAMEKKGRLRRDGGAKSRTLRPFEADGTAPRARGVVDVRILRVRWYRDAEMR